MSVRAAQALPWALAAMIAAGFGVYAATRGGASELCDPEFLEESGRCVVAKGACPPPLVRVVDEGSCDAPEVRVRVEATTIVVGPSDWEAEGRVPSRTVHAEAFYMGAFEVTARGEGVRAASAMTRDEAAALCSVRGGRLPTDDEWLVAASATRSGASSRYPWGDTGAVCRRAAWGLAQGPCARGADGPGAVGAHRSGDTPSGLHDVAGNVAEWVAPDPSRPEVGVARGGSWAASLATDLRTWSKLELPAASRDPRVGVRCAYDAP
jgi:formylglycine-generating enzyme required for sulfatase activity